MVNYFDLFLNHEWFLWLLKFSLLFHILLLLFYSYYVTKGPLHLILLYTIMIYPLPLWNCRYFLNTRWVSNFWICFWVIYTRYTISSWYWYHINNIDICICRSFSAVYTSQLFAKWMWCNQYFVCFDTYLYGSNKILTFRLGIVFSLVSGSVNEWEISLKCLYRKKVILV